ncbi:hypothetical protein CDD83_3135 [Cordyceps sp. RAO-2017]|nr:hypothetical protein CDD83_3135 [Cordyceps sp. RAO-2017]
MVRAVFALLSLPVLALCGSLIPTGLEARDADGSVLDRRGANECRSYQDCPICGFYERCCLRAGGSSGFCTCGTSGRESQCL